MSLDGCKVFTNSLGSHYELRKLHTRVELIVPAILKSGGIYMYASKYLVLLTFSQYSTKHKGNLLPRLAGSKNFNRSAGLR